MIQAHFLGAVACEEEEEMMYDNDNDRDNENEDDDDDCLGVGVNDAHSSKDCEIVSL